MSQAWYLRLDGIVGDSTAERHAGEIEVASWSLGVTRSSGPPGGTGSATGRPQFADLEIATSLNSTSLGLFVLAATGRHVRTAVLSGVRPGEPARDFMTIKLSDVTVTASRLDGEAAATVLEHFALDYRRIELTYRPLGPTGAPSTPITAGFDVALGSVV